MKIYEIAIVGAGPAGMAAAWGAKKQGCSDILILERQEEAGGVLNQCIHDGFGLVLYGHSYTGPEYAQRWKEKTEELADIKTNCSVVDITARKDYFCVCCIGKNSGYEVYGAKSVIFATGCRERTLGQMRIPGGRPAGIYTAGCAQYMMNIQNLKPGNTAVIFGTGDIGLIMARRFMLEGIRVKLMVGDRPSGLARNYMQCIQDFQIPLKLGYTVLGVHGYQRLKGVTIAPLDPHGNPMSDQREYIPCDTLLTAAGLIPETELGTSWGIPLSAQKGLLTDEEGRTLVPGLYACGNVTDIYDLADYVTVSGIKTGAAAARDLGYVSADDSWKPVIKPRKERTFEGMDQLSSEETICVLCPRGCRIHCMNGEDGIKVSGNGCEKGHAYALRERTSPERILTTTMKISKTDRRLLPVHTTKPIPREKLREAVHVLNGMTVQLPVKEGTILVKHLLGTDAHVAASRSME